MTTQFTLTTTLILGALHALEPGHGKSFIATYILGNSVNKKELVRLILSMILSHGFFLAGLSLILVFLLPELNPDVVHHYAGTIIPLFVIGIGVIMLIKTFRKQSLKCSCAFHQQMDNSKSNFHPFLNKNKNLHAVLKLTVNEAAVKKSSAVGVGVLAGVMPCPGAIAAFLGPISTGSGFHTLWSVLLYILGFSLVMVFIVMLAFYLGRKLNKFSTQYKWERKIQFFSSIIIILLGIYYILAHNVSSHNC